MGLLSVAEAAEEYGVHPATVRRWIDRGLIPAYRVGERRIGIKASDLAGVVAPRPARQGPGATKNGRLVVRRRLTREEQARGLRALAEMERLSAELSAEHGKLTPESWVLLNESRDERSRQLAGDDED